MGLTCIVCRVPGVGLEVLPPATPIPAGDPKSGPQELHAHLA